MLLKRDLAEHFAANIAWLFLEIKFGICIGLLSMESGVMRLLANWRYDLEANFTADS
jgi:hypothetical protein